VWLVPSYVLVLFPFFCSWDDDDDVLGEDLSWGDAGDGGGGLSKRRLSMSSTSSEAHSGARPKSTDQGGKKGSIASVRINPNIFPQYFPS
jgi:hypothetical protein